jgi:zinc transporter ZupT
MYTKAMLTPKMIGLSMTFGAIMGYWLGLSITNNIVSVWNFIIAFFAGSFAFFVVYYFYKWFY